MPYWIKPDGQRVAARQAQRLLGTKDRAKVAALEPSWRHVPGAAKLLYCYPMALSVDEVLAKMRSTKGRYQETLSLPQPWD
jgi:hypothetical protein